MHIQCSQKEHMSFIGMMLFIPLRTPPCLCCSFLEGLLPFHVVPSWKDFSLFWLLISRRTTSCLYCLFLREWNLSMISLLIPGRFHIYVVHSWEDSSLFILFLSGKTIHCLCYLFLWQLLPVYVVHSWGDPSLILFIVNSGEDSFQFMLFILSQQSW